MAECDETLLAKVSDVLVEHDVTEPRGYAFLVCECGTEFGNWETAREHQARAVLEMVRARVGAEPEPTPEEMRQLAIDNADDRSLDWKEGE